MKQYSRVSYGIRCQIYALLQTKKSISEISSILGFHKSTIYRELKRNKTLNNTYHPDSAHVLAQRRYSFCRKQYKVTKNNKNKIIKLLKFGLSPELISGRLKKEHGEAPSHQTIYNYVYYAGQRGYLKNNGKRGGGRYIQRKSIKKLKHGENIRKRPQIANRRGRIGDWERDTMHTLNGVQVLVCQDRKSRLIKIGIVEKRTSMEIGKLTEKLITKTGKKAYTVTNDNGGDFKGKSKMKLKTYFCDPMSPHQRGSVENVIRSIREYIGRKTDVSKWKKRDLELIEYRLNNRPRKVLGYRTPNEVYFNKRVALANLI